MKRFFTGIGFASIVTCGAASAADLPVKAVAPPPPLSPWEVEVGTRVWFSTGTIGAPSPLTLPDAGHETLLSRLTFQDQHAISGEVFGRLDHISGFFVKGNAGLGRITGGSMFDEDFPASLVYSNTLQSNNRGHLAYGTIDGGYTFWTGPGAKVGYFIGYNYYLQHSDTFGCQQLARDRACLPGQFSPSFNGISEDDSFSSLRIGISGRFMLNDRLRLTVEAAYLPFVHFQGVDNHNARGLVINETSNTGDGVQLEASLDYALTNAINVGVGARYWNWNMRTGDVVFIESEGVAARENARFNTERFGAFVQASYHWGDVTPAAVSPAGIYKAPPPVFAPSWAGFYIGTHLGGGMGDDHWTAASLPQIRVGPFVNAAGFGDHPHVAGPLSGGQIGWNFQPGGIGGIVFGVEADASLANIRGESTCFSQIGGVNCRREIGALATLTGRLGVPWGRSLLYVKGGGAWEHSNLDLNADTAFLTSSTFFPGEVKVSANQFGWVVGTGLEYAINGRWSATAEYNFMSFGSHDVTFSNLAFLTSNPVVSVREDLHVAKVGVNYKFGAEPVVSKY